jgi:hypothetical protein
MPLAKLHHDPVPVPSAKAGPPLTSALDDMAPVHSPALALQHHLAQRAITAAQTDVEKWSPRRSLALIVAASAALWMAILMAGAEASKMIA